MEIPSWSSAVIDNATIKRSLVIVRSRYALHNSRQTGKGLHHIGPYTNQVVTQRKPFDEQ
ncbi:hypothetical protein GOX01_19720 [Gluconobacter oxydans]|nr:hypothetical protein GOX01_19720 [Gluconobacter oxydans]